MFCVNCGKQIESYFKFCPYCGTNISTGTQPDNANSDFKIIAGKLIEYTGSNVDVIIPNNVVEIGNEVFKYMRQLKSVFIPNSVKHIGYMAFAGCTSLTSITFPVGINSIGWGAFKNCSSLKSVVLPDSITCIYDEAFQDCYSLVNIKLPSKLPYLSPLTFAGCCELEKIEIPDSVLEIRRRERYADNMQLYKDVKTSCFVGCNKLKNITYPAHLTPEDFFDTPVYKSNFYINQVSNGICPECGRKLSLFSNKCKYCNIIY